MAQGKTEKVWNTVQIGERILLTSYYRGSITVVVTMSRTKVHRLGDLQLAIMKILWEKGDATVADVHGILAGERDLAYTTVATMLRKMEVRGLVKHRLDGRSFVYSAGVAEDAVS